LPPTTVKYDVEKLVFLLVDLEVFLDVFLEVFLLVAVAKDVLNEVDVFLLVPREVVVLKLVL
jgi:hypothetical protein